MGNDRRDMWRAAGMLSMVGIVLAVSIIGCFLVGYYLDRRLGTLPWLSIVGLVLGIAAGFREVMRIVRRFAKDF